MRFFVWLVAPIAAVAFFAVPHAALAANATASTSDYQLGFGPFVGGGSISTGADIRNTSGYQVSLERNFPLTGHLALGPRFELADSFVNAKASNSGVKSLSTYDNRIVAAGFRLSQDVGTPSTFAQGLYLTGTVGRGYSKLAVDESSDRAFSQNLYSNIGGSYFGSEVGSFIPLKGSFGINLAMLGNLYRADQSDSTCTKEGDNLDSDEGLNLTESSGNAKSCGLDKVVTIRTYALKVGLSLGF